MFKRPSVHYGRMPEPVTPYQKAAQVWDQRIGSARVQAKNWRLMAFGCLTLASGLAGGLVWQSSQGSITPWVVEVDRLGQAQELPRPTLTINPPTLRSPTIWRVLLKMSEAYPPTASCSARNWLRAYDFTTDRGAAALNDFARNNDPFVKLGKAQISVDVSSVIRASPDSFRVAWVQRTYDYGSLSSTERWTAILTVVIETPRNAERLRRIRSACMYAPSIGRRSWVSDQDDVKHFLEA